MEERKVYQNHKQADIFPDMLSIHRDDRPRKGRSSRLLQFRQRTDGAR